jgi:hypothetical protein
MARRLDVSSLDGSLLDGSLLDGSSLDGSLFRVHMQATSSTSGLHLCSQSCPMFGKLHCDMMAFGRYL